VVCLRPDVKGQVRLISGYIVLHSSICGCSLNCLLLQLAEVIKYANCYYNTKAMEVHNLVLLIYISVNANEHVYVKLSLCLTNYHVTKTYPLLN
jgi:hypothetical protein